MRRILRLPAPNPPTAPTEAGAAEASTSPWRRHDTSMRDLSLAQVLRSLPALVTDALRMAWSASWPLTTLVLALGVLSAAATAFGLLAVTHALTEILAAGPTPERVRSSIPALTALVTAGVAQTLLGVVSGLCSGRLGVLVEHEADMRFLALATRVDLDAFDDPDFYDALDQSRLRGTSAAARLVAHTVTLSATVIGLLATASVFTALHPLLLPLLLLSALPLGWSAARSARAGYRHMWFMSSQARQQSSLYRMMTDKDEAAEVRAFALAASLRRRYGQVSETVMAAQFRLQRQQNIESLTGTALSAAGMGVVYLAILVLLSRGHLAAASAGGAFVAAQAARGRLSTCVRTVNDLYEQGLYFRDFARFCELAALRSREAATRDVAAGVVDDLEELSGTGLTYTYPGQQQPALVGVDITVRRGEVVALVGENGSGKTTLAKVLAGLYQPQTGQLTLNGDPRLGASPSALAARIGVLFQNFSRWPFSVTDNITVGDISREQDTDAAREAARAAGVDDFTARLPHGMDTVLTRSWGNGSDLSGGQWQRVALARAFFRNAPLLILDEPTAALDARAEHAVFEQVRKLCEGRSVLLISHRLASVRSADRIYVLDRGRVSEVGNHEQLMARGGLYAELFTLQASAYLEAGQPAGDVAGGTLGAA